MIQNMKNYSLFLDNEFLKDLEIQQIFAKVCYTILYKFFERNYMKHFEDIECFLFFFEF